MDRLRQALLRLQAWLRGLADARDEQLQAAWRAGAFSTQRLHALREEELRLEELREAVTIALAARGDELRLQAHLRDMLWRCGREDLRWTLAHLAGGTDLELVVGGLGQRVGAGGLGPPVP